jgi:hypothetical protein
MVRPSTLPVVALLIAVTLCTSFGLQIKLANSSTSSITVVPTGDVAPTTEEGSTSSARPVLVHSSGPPAAVPAAAPGDAAGGEGEVERGHEHLEAHTDLETMRSILASLPEPEPEVVDALARPGISDAELRILLRKVWDRRQAMLKHYMDNIKTDADFMKSLIERLMVPGTLGGVEEEDPRVGVLEDLEFHVGKVDNAKDFKTVGAPGHGRRWGWW